MPELTFEPRSHTYAIGERVLPGVTQIIKEAGIIDATWYSDWARDRGSAVHLACQLLDEGDLDESSLDPRIRGYLDAWEACKRELGVVTMLHSELPLGSLALGYAGTLDRVVMVSDPELWDIKSGVPGRAGGVQTAAYARLLEECREIVKVRRCVQLRADGKYTIHTYRDRADWAVFQAALTLHNWRHA